MLPMFFKRLLTPVFWSGQSVLLSCPMNSRLSCSLQHNQTTGGKKRNAKKLWNIQFNKGGWECLRVETPICTSSRPGREDLTQHQLRRWSVMMTAQAHKFIIALGHVCVFTRLQSSLLPTWFGGFLASTLCSSWPPTRTSFLPASPRPKNTWGPGSADPAPWFPWFQRCPRTSCPGNCCCPQWNGDGSISRTFSPDPQCSIGQRKKENGKWNQILHVCMCRI